MINSWSLLYDELYGDDEMSEEIKIDTSIEGVVNVPNDVNLDDTSGDINIERSSTDMYLVGDSTSQNRVLAQKGIANLVCVGTNEYVLMGGGIT